MGNKEKLDQMIENTKIDNWICCVCVEEFYKKEIDSCKTLYVYPGSCYLCGKERNCVSNKIWRSIIYKHKRIDWLIERFEKDVRDHYYVAFGFAMHTESAKAILHRILYYDDFSFVKNHIDSFKEQNEIFYKAIHEGWRSIFKQTVQFWPDRSIPMIDSTKTTDWLNLIEPYAKELEKINKERKKFQKIIWKIASKI